MPIDFPVTRRGILRSHTEKGCFSGAFLRSSGAFKNTPKCSAFVFQISARSIHSRFGTQKELQHKAKMCNAPALDLLMHWRHSLTKNNNQVHSNESSVPHNQNWGCCANPDTVVKSKVWYSLSLVLSRLTPANPACRRHTELYMSFTK